MGDPDPNDIPMWQRTRNVAPTPKSAIVQPPVGDNFAIKGYFLKMVCERQFDGRVWADPYKHVVDFLEICGLFNCGTNMEEAVRLRMFPLSLTGESRFWYDELEPESITTWEQMRDKFVRRFFPPVLVARLLNEIRGFQQHDSESLVEAWLRIKKMLRNCHGHGLSREQIIEIFYHGLDSQSAAILDVSYGGIFLYKSSNAAYQMLEDMVLFNYDWSRTSMDKPASRIAASVEGVGHYTRDDLCQSAHQKSVDSSQPLDQMDDPDPNDTPMWERTRNVAPIPKSAIVQPPLGDNFSIKGYLLKMVRERQFDGRVWADPYKHVVDFLRICGLFNCGTNMAEAVRLRMFPFSLTGESRIWYDELEPESITTWEQMRDKFVRRFFPPVLVAQLLNEIRGFQQHDSESLVEAWLRIKKMLRNCHGHGLSTEQIIEIFYHGLDSRSAAILDVSSGGIFLYKSSKAAYQMLEDKVLFNYDLSRENDVGIHGESECSHGYYEEAA